PGRGSSTRRGIDRTTINSDAGVRPGRGPRRWTNDTGGRRRGRMGGGGGRIRRGKPGRDAGRDREDGGGRAAGTGCGLVADGGGNTPWRAVAGQAVRRRARAARRSPGRRGRRAA